MTSLNPKIEKSFSARQLETKITPTPNLTSNFETHKNLGDNFLSTYEAGWHGPDHTRGPNHQIRSEFGTRSELHIALLRD